MPVHKKPQPSSIGLVLQIVDVAREQARAEALEDAAREIEAEAPALAERIRRMAAAALSE